MKKIVFLKTLLFLLINTFFSINNAFSQTAPQGFNYQAVARDNAGNLYANQNIRLRLSIQQNGNNQYIETHNATTNAFGLFSLVVGQGSPTFGTFQNMAWNTGSKAILTEIDPLGNGNFVNVGTTILQSVPYALYAQNSGNNTANGIQGMGTNQFLAKFNGSTSITNSQIVDNGQSIGIGTTTPDAQTRLHLANGKMMVGTPNGTLARMTINSDAAEDALRVRVNTTTHLLVGANGNVGIGVSPAAYKLDINSSNRITAYATNDFLSGALNQNTASSAATSAFKGEYLGNGNNDGIGIYGRSTSPSNGYGFGGFFEGGYAGILGRTTSTAFDAAGVFAYGNVGNRSALYVSANGANLGVYVNGGGTYTGTWTMSSDEKLKTNIVDLKPSLNKIMALNPKQYQYKRGEFGTMDLPSGTHFGFLAQDLQKIFPELVEKQRHTEKGKSEQTDYLSVNYIELIPIMVSAIQELQKQNENLQKQIDELKK